MTNLIFAKRNSIAYITVNRPKVLNALNGATIEQLGAAFAEVESDDSIRLAILTGAGEKAFAAGADISEIAVLDETIGKEFARRGQRVFDLIENLSKPVIACVNGFALGGGCELAMACTIRIASENARFGQPEVKLGVIPGYGGTQRLPRLIGRGRAMQLLLTGEIITAQEALRMGLVNEVTVLADLIPRAEAVAQSVISNARLGIEGVMKAVNRGIELPWEQALALEADLFGVCCKSEDKKEGTAAFLEKRAAKFTGR
jgi:enoyl-CoA hydratase/carnithine racemase